MRKGKYEAAAPAKRRGNKSIALLLALFLLIGTVVGGTLAWLIDSSAEVTDTFTYGDVEIELYEGATGDKLWATEQNVKDRAAENKLVPGGKITMDPYVEVAAKSEDCYLFVKVETTGFDNLFEDIEIADDWVAVSGANNIYSKQVAYNDTNATRLPIIKDNTLQVKTTVRKDNLATLTNAANLKITAYAIQSANLTDTDADANTTVDAIDAWTLLQAQLNP